MIQYRCQYESDDWLCFMTELWHMPGSNACKTLMQLPDGSLYLDVLWSFTGENDRVVAVPDLGISFFNASYEDASSHLIEKGVDPYVAASIYKTLEVMYQTAMYSTKKWDCKHNLAGGCDMIVFKPSQKHSIFSDD